MAGTPAQNDPWDQRGLPFTRLWPVFVGVAAGAVIAAILLALDRPSSGITPILVIGGTLVGGLAAALAPAGQRSARFLDVAFPCLVAGVSARFFGAVGTLVLGRDVAGDAADTALVYVFVMAFFVGFPLLVAKVFQNPARRLPDPVLAQIGEPYPTRREPKLVTVRAADGTTHRISVLRGGFVAGVRIPFDVSGVTGVVAEGTVATGPRSKRAGAGPSGRRTGSAPSGPAPSKARGRKGSAGEEDEAGGSSERARTAPAPTSRTTPKGTTGPRKRTKR